MSRTRKQYNEFRRAFKKWCAKYRPSAGEVSFTTFGSVVLLGEKKQIIAEYVAPGYERYVRYVLRSLVK